MNITFEPKFKLEMVTILPGEYYATRERRIISTVLGSCIAVALYDPVNKVGGMNHFMLPRMIDKDLFYISESGRYGMNAMELLINEMIKLGARKKNIRSKVFGGGNVLQSIQGCASKIAENNIKFAFEYLEAEKIPIASYNVGGTQTRRVYFFNEDAKILLRISARREKRTLKTEEAAYMKRIKRPSDKGVTLF